MFLSSGRNYKFGGVRRLPFGFVTFLLLTCTCTFLIVSTCFLSKYVFFLVSCKCQGAHNYGQWCMGISVVPI